MGSEDLPLLLAIEGKSSVGAPNARGILGTLDIEWVHAMAPGAKIVLVIGPNNGSDLDEAVNYAVVHRRPRPGVIFHSNRGVEYAAYAVRNRLAALGFVQSMNRPREITDNAHMESFFHSMKSDAVHGMRFAEHAELVRLLRGYIPYYNGVRLHSGIGYSSPVAYEARAT